MSDKRLAAIERGRRMREWAHGDGGLFAVFDAVERDYVRSIRDSEPTEAALREAVYHRMAALRDIRRVMTAAVAHGAGEQKMIEKLSRMDQG